MLQISSGVTPKNVETLWSHQNDAVVLTYRSLSAVLNIGHWLGSLLSCLESLFFIFKLLVFSMFSNTIIFYAIFLVSVLYLYQQLFVACARLFLAKSTCSQRLV